MIMRASEAELPSRRWERLSDSNPPALVAMRFHPSDPLETVEGFDPDSEVADLVWRASPPKTRSRPRLPAMSFVGPRLR